MRKGLLITILLGLCSAASFAQTVPDRETLDTLGSILTDRTRGHFRTESEIAVNRVVKKGRALDFYFTSDASFFPWHSEDLKWFRAELARDLDSLTGYWIPGALYSSNNPLDSYVTHRSGNDGRFHQYGRAIKDPRGSDPGFIRRKGALKYPKGLDGRYISLWQSHGLYYDDVQDYWHFQRAPLFRTVEDLYTQSYVIPFLIPMLENAGACVMTPRERDINPIEYVADNDPSFEAERTGSLRRSGKYSEQGPWEYAGTGFADTCATYDFLTNPFRTGTARMVKTSSKKTASARWSASFEKRGEYAVYISYKSLENSTEAAKYKVRHMGGETEFTVNQKRGGSTWIYLGTFEFDKGDGGFVELDNSGRPGAVVTADAVRFGGGMGKVDRGGSVSGAKSHVEGALYSMVWAGAEEDVTQDRPNEYTNEYASRGAWTVWMKDSKHIPFDLSLAFHSNAGITSRPDSTYGTLAIYTRRSEDGMKLKDGRDRNVSRLLCDFVQSQIVSDIRASYDSLWTCRGIWDKNYSESRTTGVPAMILELLSHQNFNDMKLGLDPSFRFTVCRAVYKGILKTLSDYYACPYVVQPLPVSDMAVRFTSDDRVLLSWSPTEDPAEPTAKPDAYIVYTRIDGGAFNSGEKVSSTMTVLSVKPGHIYSWKVVAFNEGGSSFPSEILSAGIPEEKLGGEVVVVNNFTRVGAPSWFDTPEYAGFDGRLDSGVPYIRDISYIGETYEFRRDAPYVDDDYPGFGGSWTDHAGEVIAGNTFDYPYIHGRALMKLGRPFSSMSVSAFTKAATVDGKTVDLICGKQGLSQDGRYPVWTEGLKDAVRKAARNGSGFIVSGASIASDSSALGFTGKAFGYSGANPAASSTGRIGGMPFFSSMNPDSYCVECPDGLKPAWTGRTFLRYDGTGVSAAVLYDAGRYRSVSFGVPLETLVNESDRISVLKDALKSLDGDAEPVDHH